MYKASVKNVTKGTWLMSENCGEIRYTEDADKRLVFYNENDAEDILIMVEDYSSDCHALNIE